MSHASDREADPYALAATAAEQLRARTGPVDLAVVLGSGWNGVVPALGGDTDGIPMSDLAGFAAPTAAGHAGRVHVLDAGPRRVLVLAGRTHFYEHRDPVAVVHGVRTAAAAGARAVVLTNAAGGLRPEWPSGTPVLIADHLNLTGATPLQGARFVDLTDAYSPALRAHARAVRPTLPEGVYAQFTGPQYETPAEVRMAGLLGADLVGMSTALETIAAREAGLEVLGLSLVTNPAAGIGTALDHDDVLATGRAAAEELGALLAEILTTWPA
ncbi:purine-nucleoside phosphorylase [Sporichthya brevicatena]|uniref:purine-nucleoside phosphorylase n=1 Tax=Sporichthya brevicatena TaxID=171442 RepID=UPI0031CF33FA